MLNDLRRHYVSKNLINERCGHCNKPASHRVEEVVYYDDPSLNNRSPHGAYLCCEHYSGVFGPDTFCDKKGELKKHSTLKRIIDYIL